MRSPRLAASCSRTLFLLAILSLAASRFACADNQLENPGFENGLTDWTLAPAGSTAIQVLPAAAMMGKSGLRVTTGGGDVAVLLSKKIPAVASHVYRFTGWWHWNGGKPASLSLVFYGKDGAVVPPVPYPGFWPQGSPKDLGQSNGVILQAMAPDAATSVAVSIEAPKGGEAGSTDVDDCSFGEIPLDAAKRGAPGPPIDTDALLAEIKSNPTRGAAPPDIVIKLDDFGLVGLTKGAEKVVAPDQSWQRIEQFVEKRKIKVGIGIVVKSLEVCGQPFIDWIKKMHDSGMVEFWYHGYDHAGWKDDKGTWLSEFYARPYADQKAHFDMSQKLMMDKLGFPLLSFGPPGGPPDAHTDATTDQVMQDDPYMTSWLYDCPMDPAGKALMAKGKVTVLDRVWSVNLEVVVGHPSFAAFLEGYAHNRGRKYFILQGHPPLWGWGNDRFDEFFKIVDFLQSQGATFMTPTELATAVKSGAGDTSSTASQQASTH